MSPTSLIRRSLLPFHRHLLPTTTRQHLRLLSDDIQLTQGQIIPADSPPEEKKSPANTLAQRTDQAIQHDLDKNLPWFARHAQLPHDQLDFEPSPLHLVWRVKSMSGRPHWEKNIMRQLRLDVHIGKLVVLKNTPSVNELLWTVKHLIRVRPIVFSDVGGRPTKEQMNTMVLKRTGELVNSRYARYNAKGRAVNNCALERYVLHSYEKQVRMWASYRYGSLTGTLDG